MKKTNLSDKVRLAAMGCVLLVPISMWADSGTLTGDASVDSGSANYGGLPTLNVGGGIWSSLVQFDFSSIPTGIVAKATLRLYVNKVTTPGTVDLGTANGTWNESTVTGATAPGIGSALGSAPISTTGFVTFDVTAQVAAWVGGSPNNGFILNADPGTPAVYVNLDSKENASTSHPATLEIIFRGANGATGPTGPQGPSGAAGPAGAVGVAGAAGPSGAAGATGPTGASGPSGASGPTGPNGPTGASPAGAAGLAGPAGAGGTAGPTGATGPKGASGATGTIGTQGSPGAAGATGASGVAGPGGPGFSNIFSMDTTVHGGSFIMPDNTTSVTLVTGAATVTLPNGTVAGKKIWIVTTTPGTTFTIQRQASDVIFRSGFPTQPDPGETSFSSQFAVELWTDGLHHWYLTFAGI